MAAHHSIGFSARLVGRSQDTAKSTYDITPETALVDLNRAGAPLMELVTEPDLRSERDAVAFVSKLQQILRALDASPASLEAVRACRLDCVSRCPHCQCAGLHSLLAFTRAPCAVT